MNSRWAIYYDDGTWASSAVTFPPALVKVGVVTIRQEVERAPGHMDIVHVNGFDFYWPNDEDNRWWGGDIFGLWDYLTQPGKKIVLFGRSVPAVAWNQVLDLAKRHTWAECAGSHG